MNSFGKKLIKLRNENGLSQEALADKLGVSRQSISKWEIGMAIPRSSKVNKLCKIFDISADELFDNKKVDNENKEENPVASDKKKFNFKVMLKCIAIILIILLVLHLIYAVYKFCVLNYVTNKVAQYKNLDNYYCNIRTYETDDIYESTEIWYKDQKYKIKTVYYGEEENKNISYTEWIDCKTKKIYCKMQQDENVKQLNAENSYFNSYNDGSYLYNEIPDIVKNNKHTIILNSISLKFVTLQEKKGYTLFKTNNKSVHLNKDTYLPLSYIVEQQGKQKQNYEIKYYEVRINEVEDQELRLE